MAHKIRIILNVEEDVIRDIAIDPTETLEDLHNVITNAFGFSGNEMASFYKTDDDWVQGEEFPLFDMSDGLEGKITMAEMSIDNLLLEPHHKLIYVYDFFNMWTFYVELIEVDVDVENYELPGLLFSLGNVPKNAPDLNFEGENTNNGDKSDFNEDLDDDFDGFDFDQYDEYN